MSFVSLPHWTSLPQTGSTFPLFGQSRRSQLSVHYQMGHRIVLSWAWYSDKEHFHFVNPSNDLWLDLKTAQCLDKFSFTELTWTGVFWVGGWRKQHDERQKESSKFLFTINSTHIIVQSTRSSFSLYRILFFFFYLFIFFLHGGDKLQR